MRILVVNDDGIRAEGICRLAAMAVQLGEVWVVAPKNQCSAMSHRISVFDRLEVSPVPDFPVPDVHAFFVDGTPADCVKVALSHLMPEKPDVVFSGINYGYNAGVDILYSGTVGAAMEARVCGILAIAFSNDSNSVYEAADEYLLPLTKELLVKPIAHDRIWNVNFPGCPLSALKGILWDRLPADEQYYHDHYIRSEGENGSFYLTPDGTPITKAREGSDVDALLNSYISVGTIRNAVMEWED